jgi:hypothetical protein
MRLMLSNAKHASKGLQIHSGFLAVQTSIAGASSGTRSEDIQKDVNVALSEVRIRPVNGLQVCKMT